MKEQSKALEFIYQDTEIHFLLGTEKDVMVNATEMAKIFKKEIKDFMRLDSTKNFINSYLKRKNRELKTEESPFLEEQIYTSKQKSGTYMIRPFALKFAAWLDSDFEVWIFETIDTILFGHYKEHWDAHLKQEDAKKRMEAAKSKLLLNATQEDVIAYFKAEIEFKTAQSDKTKAIKNQYSIFD
ncbi:KilA-N domain-containing protein [Flavobacterium sp. FZUC8N2.13]|uniref:KilA-N domain-containing protein n=1 Tax=Flavobacterium zubiriense TaxID=3138075 RepID=A0ABV4TDX2_9FLAO